MTARSGRSGDGLVAEPSSATAGCCLLANVEGGHAARGPATVLLELWEGRPGPDGCGTMSYRRGIRNADRGTLVVPLSVAIRDANKTRRMTYTPTKAIVHQSMATIRQLARAAWKQRRLFTIKRLKIATGASALLGILAGCNLSGPVSAPLPPPPGGIASLPDATGGAGDSVGAHPGREHADCLARVATAMSKYVDECTSAGETKRKCVLAARERYRSDRITCGSLLPRRGSR